MAESRVLLLGAIFLAIVTLYFFTKPFRLKYSTFFDNALLMLCLFCGVAALVAINMGASERISDFLIASGYMLGFFWIGRRAASTWRSWRDEPADDERRN